MGRLDPRESFWHFEKRCSISKLRVSEKEIAGYWTKITLGRRSFSRSMECEQWAEGIFQSVKSHLTHLVRFRSKPFIQNDEFGFIISNKYPPISLKNSNTAYR